MSIDPRTSWLGYYSRFNGGLVSQICYALLYWAFVSHMSAKQSLYAIRYSLISTAIAAAMAVVEHYGIFTTCGIMGFGYRESCWVQDVQNRVFSTLGQPNWLAATITALIPMTWYFAIFDFKFLIFNKLNSNFKFQISNLIWLVISMLFFVTLLFTKSRSGLLAFGIEAIVFWGFLFLREKNKYLKEFIFIFLSFNFLAFIFWFLPSIQLTNNQASVSSGPALETGGTESGTIRKDVWLGAIEVFKHYPILGTGPETFAFSFPMYKPVEHNLTSEWDFIYNKAHNEYLNLLANVGVLGFLSYSLLILVSIKQIAGNLQFTIYNLHSISNLKINKNENSLIIDNWKLRIGLLSGYIAILVTNFFGFSVVPVSLLFFLFPALTVQSTQYEVLSNGRSKLDVSQVIGVIFVLCTMSYVLFCIAKYWQADVYYNKSNFDKAISISPNEPNYISKLALSDNSVETALKAVEMNPYNQNSRKILISNLVKSSTKDSNGMKLAEAVIKNGILLSPNDPRLYYQLGILQLRIGEQKSGIDSLIKSTLLKPNYKEARFALGATYLDVKEFSKAKIELEYILKNIDPNDELTKNYLKELL